jgi:hypothetical protein
VTAVSNSAATCQVFWNQQSQQMSTGVMCRDTGEDRSDQQFDVILTDHVGLKGPGGKHVAYLMADRDSAPSYTASRARRYSSAGISPIVKRTGKGAYTVVLGGMPLGGAAVVTPLAIKGATLCSIASIAQLSKPQQIGVRCFDSTGHAKDVQFSLQYLR